MKPTKNLSSLLFFIGTIILFSFTLTSCQNQSTEFEWTEKEKEIARKEISNIAKVIIESAERVDI